jgi:hypothetical protein
VVVIEEAVVVMMVIAGVVTVEVVEKRASPSFSFTLAQWGIAQHLSPSFLYSS